ncbi:alpha-L-rhamnosidase-related protein [Embleya hyalina]|uniref:Alpha-L-rhamnosidase n=1 Tax=Embleya hyalina TaxID=516124 RepID=A0A401YK10_9ACTN|nr:alpha-L-rhamnosidase C-terminal domain-containing protein [Embleya hyalina]GCD94950.1 alpha-L-rhamnosidase [Embleya hyalina]
MRETFANRRWRGQWIWAEHTAVGAPSRENPMNGSLDPERFDRRVLFRRTFELTEVPDHAPFRISSDSRHVLYVNGVELARGPIRHGGRRLYYDVGDAATALRPGRNVIAVLARFYGHRTAWWVPSPTTYSLGGGALVAEFGLGAERWIGTDTAWRCRVPDAWTPCAPRSAVSPQIPEILDARRLDPAWTHPDFDDKLWDAATVLAAAHVGSTGATRPPAEPYGALLPNPLPALGGATRTPAAFDSAPLPAAPRPEGPLTFADVHAALLDALTAIRPEARPDTVPDPAVDAPSPTLALPAGRRLVIADLGRMVGGTVRLDLEAPPGTVVFGALTESPTPAALASAACFAYTARGDEAGERFRLGDPAGGRYVLLVVDAVGPVRLAPAVLERLRPRPAGPYFACSDPLLERIHRVGLRTVDLTAHDAYIDCPSREQRAWTGDAVVHQSVDLVTNPDWSLARHQPVLTATPRGDGLLPMVAAGDGGDPELVGIPDWSLHWVRSVYNLHRYTGDRTLIARLLPAVETVLDWFTAFLGADGLVHDVTGWVLIDWSPVQVEGTSAALNALWARALGDFAEMAHRLGDANRAARARESHDAVRVGFEVFWDEERGGYRDHAVDDVVRPAMSEHTTAAAVCADLVPAERADRVRRFLLARDVMFTLAPVAAHGGDADGAPTGHEVARFTPPAVTWDARRLVVGAQPFFRYVVHDALALLGAADTIADLCRDWRHLLASGPTAWRETWEGGSYCHGWSSTPTRDLLVYTLGITPAEPGYTTVRIAPRLGDLDWAKGAVPTPYGLVHVAVEGTRVHVESPVPVRLVAPDGTVVDRPAGTFDADLTAPAS